MIMGGLTHPGMCFDIKVCGGGEEMFAGREINREIERSRNRERKGDPGRQGNIGGNDD